MIMPAGGKDKNELSPSSGNYERYSALSKQIKKIVISKEGDGAFAVVDIDTLWRDSDGNDNHWKGRVCKVYTKMEGGWKLIMHTGVLQY